MSSSSRYLRASVIPAPPLPPPSALSPTLTGAPDPPAKPGWARASGFGLARDSAGEQHSEKSISAARAITGVLCITGDDDETEKEEKEICMKEEEEDREKEV